MKYGEVGEENYNKYLRRDTGETEEYAINLDVNENENCENKNSNSQKFFENKIARESKFSLVDVRWLTTSEAAQYLRVSISSLKTMIYRGQVRAHKLGRRNRFLRDELERLITLPISK